MKPRRERCVERAADDQRHEAGEQRGAHQVERGPLTGEHDLAGAFDDRGQRIVDEVAADGGRHDGSRIEDRARDPHDEDDQLVQIRQVAKIHVERRGAEGISEREHDRALPRGPAGRRR